MTFGTTLVAFGGCSGACGGSEVDYSGELASANHPLAYCVGEVGAVACQHSWADRIGTMVQVYVQTSSGTKFSSTMTTTTPTMALQSYHYYKFDNIQ